ncbi:MAG: hypothetical protein AAGA03_03980 [Planctomycetota bacterium]
MWWIVFAIILLAVSQTVSAQTLEQVAAELTMADGVTQVPASMLVDPRSPVPGTSSSRAQSAGVTAWLANLDADDQPDGWRAQVVLVDRNDRIVRPRGHVTIEMFPGVKTFGRMRHLGQAQRVGRWRMPLVYDENGVVNLRLPLRQSLQPLMSRDTVAFPRTVASSRGIWVYREQRGDNRSRYVHSSATDLDKAGMPTWGRMKVRVSVPGQGVFAATTQVRMREPVLVDTQWQ